MPGSDVRQRVDQGQQNRSKVYYMDGIVNTSVRAGTYVALPDIDSLQEFKVQSQSDKAEYGGVTGGVVNMTSKSGTNRYGGSVFGYFRNEEFVARNPFRDAAGAEPPPISSRASSAANLGGPVSGTRRSSSLRTTAGATATSRHPDHRAGGARARRRLLADVPRTDDLQPVHARAPRTAGWCAIRSPATSFPPNLISPTMQAFLKAYMPKPTLPGNVADNFREFRDQESNSNAFQIRVDHHFSARDNLFFRWTERRINDFIPRGDLGFQDARLHQSQLRRRLVPRFRRT